MASSAQYIVVVAEGSGMTPAADALAAKVKGYLEQGFEPVGGVAVDPTSGTKEKPTALYVQAMIRRRA